MERTLIFTQVNDIHALAVEIALKQKGENCQRIFSADFPDKMYSSIGFDEDYSFNIRSSEFNINGNEISSVWFRRPMLPLVPSSVHPDDVVMVERENTAFIKGVWSSMTDDAFWINPYDSYTKANNKITQTKFAYEIGLAIPKTIYSNDPVKIREFLSNSNNDDEYIYKPFYITEWDERDCRSIIRTTLVKAKQLPSDETLCLTPGIFQQRIKKSYEVRVTFFGSYPIAIRLDSQKHAKSKLDWRVIPPSELNIKLIELPSSIYDKCIQLMKKLGIVFGCFDFIVDKQGNYVFLEVNEMGQFLWIERANPKIKLLDVFCEFLINKQFDFEYKQTENAVRYEDAYKICEENDFLKKDALLHKSKI